MKVYSNYGLRPEHKVIGRYNNGELKVEKAGYRPAYLEIANMIASGERFEQARQFDYPNEASIKERVNHVDMSDKDKFEIIDEARNVRLELGRKIEAERLAKVQAERDKERQRIIEEYEKSKAVTAEAPTKEDA